MQFKPIKPRKIYEDIVEQIKSMITEGNLKPGDKLPSERAMSNYLKVSRASVREALSALHVMGLVEIKSGEGTFIKHVDVESIICPLAMAFLIERDTVVEILEVRKGLEVEAVGLAAERREEEDLFKIKKSLDDMRRDLENNGDGEEADWDFHYAIFEASKNSLLLRLMNTVSDTVKNAIRINRQNLFSTSDTTPEKLYDIHVSIYEAILAKDFKKAREKMFGHLRVVEDNLAEDEKDELEEADEMNEIL